jgi:4-hydroxysphinganine ceramide fatty acyl 2-hydroxylase
LALKFLLLLNTDITSSLPAWYRALKKYHLRHHFADYQNGFGVTSRFWDWVFKTELEMNQPKIIKAT